MRLSSRSYPHPVVGNADDVPQVAFQASLDYTSDRQFYFINITVASSSASLNRLIRKGSACYVLHVECGNTLYREAFDFTESRNASTSGPTGSTARWKSTASCATREIANYRVDGAHPDYGPTTFTVGAGDILAVGEGQTFEAEPQDTLRRIGSIMVIEESPKEGDHPMEVEFSGDKIRIRLCKEDFELYKKLKVVKTLASHLTTTIVLPVLIEALHLIEQDTAEFADLKWYRNLQGRLEDLKLTNEEEALQKAQVILDLPIRRAFAAAGQYAVEK